MADVAAMKSVALASEDADDRQLADLTRLLADSGPRLIEQSPDLVDIASSGGPGSLSTLLAPLYACALGARVAKIAVPGRPAGGLDSLASMPGYRMDLDVSEARAVLDECGYLHIAAGSVFCPLDARFFAWRQANGAQARPALTIASLLAKKLAAGASRVVFDIRVGAYGNLGATVEEAQEHARRLIRVAAELGITAICLLTSFERVPQPWIGRGEALHALASALNEDDLDEDLRSHVEDCARMGQLAAGVQDRSIDSTLMGGARGIHEAMLHAHGVDSNRFWARARSIAGTRRHPIVATQSGEMDVDLEGLRRIMVERQLVASPIEGAVFADPCGVKLGGRATTIGSVLAAVRDDTDPEGLAAKISAHVRVLDTPPSTTTPVTIDVQVG
jgi:pyrimidine-nucleoside phosphorylase